MVLDADLALLYGVETKALNQAVKRNAVRFPGDFLFRLSAEEAENLKSQSVTSRRRMHGGRRRSLPLAFTEQGVAMLSGVLSSARAVAVNVEIMRALVRIRHILAANAELARRIDVLEDKMVKHTAGSDRKFQVVFEVLRKLMSDDNASDPPTPIGFQVQRGQ